MCNTVPVQLLRFETCFDAAVTAIAKKFNLQGEQVRFQVFSFSSFQVMSLSHGSCPLCQEELTTPCFAVECKGFKQKFLKLVLAPDTCIFEAGL